MITKYQSKLSGPLLDRIDLHVEVPRVEYDKLMGKERGESSQQIRQRVVVARQRQLERFKETPSILSNADMGVSEVQAYCNLTAEARPLLEMSVKRMQLSARAYHRLLKLSRTIADLSSSEYIGIQHVAEAIQYRPRQQFIS